MRITKQKLATLCLMIGLFFSPFGVDAIQLILIKLTGSLLGANFAMYCLAGFFFTFYLYFSYKKNQKLLTLFLSIALFFNPFGFDAIQFGFITLTGSIFQANLIMYCISGLFFTTHFLMYKKNPFVVIKNSILNAYRSLKVRIG